MDQGWPGPVRVGTRQRLRMQQCEEVIHAFTPMGRWQPALLTSPFRPGLSRAVGTAFLPSGAHVLPLHRDLEPILLCKIQLKLLHFPWLNPKISPVRAVSRAPCWEEFSSPQNPLSQELQHPGEGREGKLRPGDDFGGCCGAGRGAASLQTSCSISNLLLILQLDPPPKFPRFAPFNYP